MMRCKEHRLGFSLCSDTMHLTLGDEFQKMLNFIAKKMETKQNEECLFTKEHAKIRMSNALIRRISRFVAGARTEIKGRMLESKDGKGMCLFMQ